MKSKGRKAKIQASRSISVPCSEPAQELQIIRPDAGGIDCGAQEHYVAVPPDRVSAGQSTVRCFSAFTEGLDALVYWLKECRVSTVAMESTGVYWIPLYQKLETAGIEVYLVNARHVRIVPGRKSDVQPPVSASTTPIRAVERLVPARGYCLSLKKSASASG